MVSLAKRLRLEHLDLCLVKYTKLYKEVSINLLESIDPVQKLSLEDRLQRCRDQINNFEQERKTIIEEIESLEKAVNRTKLQQQWTSLRSILENYNCFDRMVISYRQSLINKPSVLVEVPSGIEDLVCKLSQHRIVEIFVACLIFNSPDPVLSDELHQWGDQNIESWSACFRDLQPTQSLSSQDLMTLQSADSSSEALVQVEALPTTSSLPLHSLRQPIILIAITTSFEAATQSEYGKIYQFDAWLIYDVNTYRMNSQGYSRWERSLHNLDKTYTISEIRTLIVQCLEDFRSLSPKESYSPTVHIFLPQQFLNESIETWDSDLNNQLGCEYQICLRSIDRLSPNYRYYPLWQQKWQQTQSLQNQTVNELFRAIDESQLSTFKQELNLEFHEVLLSIKKIYKLSNTTKFESLNNQQVKDFYSELLKKPVHSLMGLLVNRSLSSDNSKYLLSLLLEAGIPLAIWQRRPLNQAAIPNTALEFLSDRTLATVPRHIKNCRREAQNFLSEAHLGHHLSFLQDDPDLVPPPYLKRA